MTATTPAHFHFTERVQVQSSERVSVSWTSNVSVTLVMSTCSSLDASAPSLWGQCTGGANFTETGSSGSVATTAPVGGYLWVVLLEPTNPGANLSAAVSVTTPFTTEALGTLGLGGVVVVVAVLLRRGKKVRPPPETPPDEPPAAPEKGPSTAVVTPPTSPGESSVEEPLD